MSAQNLLRLLLLLMLRTVLTTVWCRFGSWSLVIQLNFCSQGLVKIFKLKFRQDYEAEDFSLKSGQFFAADVWFRLRSLILVEILKLGLGALLNSGITRITSTVGMSILVPCLVSVLFKTRSRSLAWYILLILRIKTPQIDIHKSTEKLEKNHFPRGRLMWAILWRRDFFS